MDIKYYIQSVQHWFWHFRVEIQIDKLYESHFQCCVPKFAIGMIEGYVASVHKCTFVCLVLNDASTLVGH